MKPNDPAKQTEKADKPSSVQDINWNDFRDHLATADKDGHRMWIYPKKPRGRYYLARLWFSFALIAIMFAGPFIKLQGNPLLMINIPERRFSVLGVIFWPQDNLIFAFGFLLFLTGIAIFTAAFGRLWCGWTCPQTVMMEMVFRRIEYFIEGDSHEQRALNTAPWTPHKFFKKLTKHAVFLALSFIIGNTLLAYVIGSDALLKIISDNPANHVTGLTFMCLFTLLFYGIFARFREQACTFICPYGRFQSTLLDENTIVVAYDYKRGEKRGPLRRNQAPGERKATGGGDCVDCHQCVSVCPTGIDIRNGTQMECVNCTACIDACDGVMTKIGKPRGLIRFASLNGIEKGERLRVTPRIIGYCVVLTLLGLGLITLLLTRSDVDTALLRAPGGLFQTAQDGKISNLYLLKLTNKTHRDMPVQLKLENITGTLTSFGGEAIVPAEKQVESSVLVAVSPDDLKSGQTPITVGVYSNGRKLDTIKTIFIGPRK
jgi:cytochrome c oxidase accessory protein FixG